MARRKRALTQRDMSTMELRPEFLARGDTEVVRSSLKGAKNMRALSTGALEVRPGTFQKAPVTETTRAPFEMKLADGNVYVVVIDDDTLKVHTKSGSLVTTVDPVPWDFADEVWAVHDDVTLIFGHETAGIHVLAENSGIFSLTQWEFAADVAGTTAQPYWVFERGVTVTPSALTGSITLTASDPVFSADYVGLMLRYGGREVLITGFTSTTVLQGTVIDNLPPSFDVTVGNGNDFRVGEIVIGQDTNFQGLVVGVSGNVLNVVTISFFDGPDANEYLTSSSSQSKVASKVAAGSPYPSTIWDEPMMSDVRGWPGSATTGAGALIFANFPQIPRGVAVSSSSDFRDFRIGVEDDDAIAREIGDDGGRILHVVNAGDLVFLSDSGCYVQDIRNNGPITPSNFQPVKFDDRGANALRPVTVNDGLVYVAKGGETINAAVLDGNVYLKWSVVNILENHSHLILNPIALCGPSLESSVPEKYLLVVNSDGSMIAISYNTNLSTTRLGAAPWDTPNGQFQSASPIAGKYWVVVRREYEGGVRYMLETFEEGVKLDSARLLGNDGFFDPVPDFGLPGNPLTDLLGTTAWVYRGNYVLGSAEVTDIDDFPMLDDQSSSLYVGLHFDARVAPWAIESIDNPRGGTWDARCLTFMVGVRETGEFQVRCNKFTRTLGGYAFGDDLGSPPALRTRTYRIPVTGHRERADLEVIRHLPVDFQIISLGQEVQL